MSEKLLARRDEVKARHLELEARPGSGWHKKDPGSPFMNDLMPLSERPVAFLGDRRVTFVGGCADAVYEAATRFLGRYNAARQGGDAGDPPASAPDEQERRAAAAIAEQAPPEHGVLAVPRADWNDFSWAVQQEGVLCCLTSAEG